MPNEATPDTRSLFGDLVISKPQRKRPLGTVPIALVIHAIVFGPLILVPLLGSVELPEQRDAVHVLIYNPPPPPPPPLSSGATVLRTPKPTPPPTTTVIHESAMPTPEPEQLGDKGTAGGTPDGMEDGIIGGQVGGVPDGVLGGVIGGTGDVVPDYDQPPKLIRQTKPVYPIEAFKKKLEGTVVLEIIIDADGHVRQARVIRSIRELDAAALASVREWLFAPAIKNGRPVTTIANAPVSFRIY